MQAAFRSAETTADPPALSLIVVEDSIDDFDLLISRLRIAGRDLRATRVETGAALEAALAVGGVSAVISDHRLPSFTSLAALAIVRAWDPDLPFVIVSGAIGEEFAVEAMRAGADDFVMKDNLGRLDAALGGALRAAAGRRRQRDAEAALAESEARFRALTANLPGMVFQIEAGPRGMRFEYASEGSRRLFGIAPETLMEDPRHWFALFDPADVAAMRELFAPSEATPDPDRPWETRDGRKWIEHTARVASGQAATTAWIEFTARARPTGAGRVLWDGIVTDITMEKNVEAELRSSREGLRELAHHHARGREEERASIARELHDDIGATLTGVKFELAWLAGELADNATLVAHVRDVDQLVDTVILASTRIMHDLRPPILDEGIVAALEWLTRNFERRIGVRCEFVTTHDEIPLAPDPAIVVFRVCQEALNNIARHAGATSASVRLQLEEAELVLEIQDNGRGIAAGDSFRPGHFGLRGMRERALAHGGVIEIGGVAAGGTTITLRLPFDGAIRGSADVPEVVR